MRHKDEREIEALVDDMMFTFPILFRRISRDSGQGPKRFDPSRFVLFTVMKHGPLAMSEIGRRMEISRHYMTFLIDKLIEDGFVARTPDDDDRRVIRISVTKEGKESVKQMKDAMRNRVMENLSTLSTKDVASLRNSMRDLRSIITKLNQEGEKDEH